MVNYIKGMAGDFEDIIAFGNYVFNLDFKELLPKLYSGKVDTSFNHFMAKENNEIKGVVGSFPLEMKVMNETLKVKGIGTVSVHPQSRDKGYMMQLMKNAINEMKEESIDFAILGGQRQRYEYFGFTPTGSQIIFEVNNANLYHKKIRVNDNISLKSFEDISEDESNSIYTLYNQQIVYGVRSLESFADICKSWNNNAWGIYNEGIIIGYIVLSKTHDNVEEVCLEDYGVLGNVFASIINMFHKDRLYVGIAPHRQQLITYLLDICEKYKVESNTCVNIFNYKNFIKAFLTLKNSYEVLEKGELKIEIVDGEKFIIKVGDNITVEATEYLPDIKIAHLDAIKFLCDPLRIFSNDIPEINRCIKSWFPLPFNFPTVDNV